MEISKVTSGIGVASTLVLVAAFAIVQAHPASERYIPIGQSPGISGKYSYIGIITDMDEARQTIGISESGAKFDVQITEETQIWLDRTKSRKMLGRYEDCRLGSRVEIKFVDAELRDIAEWIKIEVE